MSTVGGAIPWTEHSSLALRFLIMGAVGRAAKSSCCLDSPAVMGCASERESEYILAPLCGACQGVLPEQQQKKDTSTMMTS